MCAISKDEKKIALVDKYALTRSGFVHFVTSLTGYEVIAQVDSIRTLGWSIDNDLVDILVTDLFGTSDEISSQMNDLVYYHEKYPTTHIVVYTSLQDKRKLMFLRDVIKCSVISRKEPTEEICNHLKLALQGDNSVSPAINEIINEQLDRHTLRHEHLTHQENEVLTLYLKGIGLTQIARIKNRSIKTISAHKCSGMRKLGAYSDADLFLYKRE
ncbi:LuxR C-terminal-related transcriptional regulator [Serratia fonticola]